MVLMTDKFGIQELTGSYGTRDVHILLGMLGALALMVHLGSDDIALRSIAWGTATLVGGIAIAFYGGHRFDLFSPRFLTGVVFALFYGLGSIIPFTGDQSGIFSGDIVRVLPYYPEAAAVSFFCLVGFVTGYESRFVAVWGARSRLLRYARSKGVMEALWLFLAASGTFAFALSIARDAYYQTTTELQSSIFYGSVGFIQNGIYIAATLAVSVALHTRKKIWFMLAAVSIMFLVIFSVPTGSKTMFFITLIFFGIAWNYFRGPLTRKQAVLAISAVLIALLGLMPFNMIYRDRLIASSVKDQSLTHAFTQLASSAEIYGEMEREDLFNLTLDYSQARLSHVVIVANILRYIDEGGELQLGLSYAKMFLLFIPRFIWADKPDVTLGRAVNMNIFGADASDVTSVGVTMVGEQVYNFSSVLAPFGIILIGTFFRWMYEVFRAGYRANPVIATSVYAFWWYTGMFSAHESNWAACFNGLVTYTIFLFVVLWLFSVRRTGLQIVDRVSRFA